MKLLESPFERIKDGTKTVEFRLYDEKRKMIKVGDKIEFSKLPDLQEKIVVEVEDLYREDTFKELFEKVLIDKENIRKHMEIIYTIYTKEQEKEYGALGIKINI